MAKKNTVEIVLSARDEASKEIEKAIRQTTKEFTSLNASLRKLGADSDQISKLNNEIKATNPKILENELENVRNQLKRLGLDSNEIEKITKELMEAKKAGEQAEKGLDEAKQGVNRLAKSADTAKSSLNKLADASKSAVSSIASVVTKASAALAAATAAASAVVGKMGIQFNANLEQSAIAFETLLGSAEKSKNMINDLLEMSKNSPFQFQGLQTSAKLMLAMGFNADNTISTVFFLAKSKSSLLYQLVFEPTSLEQEKKLQL